jgi:hypothetical protein
MRSSLSLFALMAALLGAALGAAPLGAPAADVARADALAANARRVEEWRKDPEHAARLQRDLNTFWNMSAERRALLRKLDQDLHQEDLATQKRLWGVLERYHSWMERLPEEDRRRIESAGDGLKRLKKIMELREQEWVRRQPPATRKRLTTLSPADRKAAVARLREEQRQRHREAMRLTPRSGRPSRLSDFPPEVSDFVRHSLKPLLTAEERQRLEQAEKKPWPVYARTLATLAEKYPIPLPGPIGPVRIADLHRQLRLHMRENPNRFPMAALQKAEGKWPEFGVVLQRIQWKKPLAQERQSALEKRFRPSHPKDFSVAIQDFLSKELSKKLTNAEQERLQKAEGKWPEYPRTLLDLSRKHDLQIPGMKLPGPRDLWDKAKAALPPAK